MLIIYLKVLSFSLLVVVFLYRHPFLTVFLVWLYRIFSKIIKFINIFEQLILKTLLKLLFLQVCVTDKFILFISLIVHEYFVFYSKSCAVIIYEMLEVKFYFCFYKFTFWVLLLWYHAPFVITELLALFQLNQHSKNPHSICIICVFM